MAETLDIVNLIENNPITSLSSDYQNRLLNKIKDKFTESQQLLFVTSFYCYLNNNSKNDFNIELDKVWKWLGFSRKDPAKVVLEKNFNKDIDYKILLQQPLEQSKKFKGGHNKEKILMNIHTFKKLCLKAGTKKADEIHEYYLMLEELLHETINEETDELRNQLLEKDKKNEKQKKIDKHDLFIEKFSSKRCVYLIEIIENKYIKIGSTKDIKKRIIEYKTRYNGASLLFLDIFESEHFREIESNIFQDTLIRKNLKRESVCGHKSNEIVTLSETFNYNQLITIIKKYVSSDITLFTPEQIIEKNKIELENNKLEFNLLNNILNNDKYSVLIENIIKDKLPELFDSVKNKHLSLFNLSTNQNNIDKQNQEENQEPNIKITNNDNIKVTEIPNYRISANSITRQIKVAGRKLLKIDPNNLQTIIKEYDTITYALRDNDNKGYQPTGIRKSFRNNTIYKGYRWLFVEKDKDVNETLMNIQPTVISAKSHPVYDCIVELNNDKTEILNTYATKKDLANHLNLSKNKLKDIMINNIQYDNKFYIEYYRCPKNLLDNYTGTIKKRLVTNTKLIKQTNPITNEITIFSSMSEITRLLGYSCKTIHKAIKNQSVYCGFKWDYHQE